MIRRASGGHTAAATAGGAPPPQFSATGSSSFPSSSPNATAAASSASPQHHQSLTGDHHRPDEKTQALPSRRLHHYYHQPLWDRDAAPAPGVAALLSTHSKRHYPPGHPLFTAGNTSVDHLDPLYASPTAAAPTTSSPPQKVSPVSPLNENDAANDSGKKGDVAIPREAPPPLSPPNASGRATTTETPVSPHVPSPSPAALPSPATVTDPPVTMPSSATPVVPPPQEPSAERMTTYYPMLLRSTLPTRPILAGRVDRMEEERRGNRRQSQRTWWNAPAYRATQPYGPDPSPSHTLQNGGSSAAERRRDGGMAGRSALGHDGRTHDPLALPSMRHYERYPPTGLGGRGPTTVIGEERRGTGSSPEDFGLSLLLPSMKTRSTTTATRGAAAAPARPTIQGTPTTTRPSLPLTQTFAMRPALLQSRLLLPSSSSSSMYAAGASQERPLLHRSRSRFSRTPYVPPPPPPSLHYKGIPFTSSTADRYNPPRLPFASAARATFDPLSLSAASGPPPPTARKYPVTPDPAPLHSSPAYRHRGGGVAAALHGGMALPPPPFSSSSSFAGPVGYPSAYPTAGSASLGWAPSPLHGVRNSRDATQRYYTTGSVLPPTAPSSTPPPANRPSNVTSAKDRDGTGESVIPTVPLSSSFLHDWGMTVAPHQQLLALRSTPVSCQQYTGASAW